MLKRRAREKENVDRKREKVVRKQEKVDFHLGNCSGFVATYKTAKQGKKRLNGGFTCIGSALVGHRIYICGSGNASYAASSLLVADSNTYKWARMNPKSDPRGSSPRGFSVTSCFVHNDMLFVLSLKGGYKITMYGLDLVVQEQWEALFPKSIDYFSGTPYGAYHEQRGEVFICDGVTLYVFNAETKRGRLQETKGRVPGSRVDLACCVSPSTFFVFGGYPLNFYKFYALSLDTMSWAIVEFESNYYFPRARFNLTMSYINGRIFVMGGGPSTPKMEHLDLFEVRSQRWKCIHSPETVATDAKLGLKLENSDKFLGTRAHSAVCTRDKLIILGGYGRHFQGLNPMELSPLKND